MDNIYIEYTEDVNYDERTDYNRNLVLDEFAFMDQTDILMKQELYEKLNVPTLKIISDFYGLCKNRKKRDLIENIIEYENNNQNEENVKMKMRYWYYINELKRNPVFSKYINIVL